MSEFVSVIVPALNAAATIERCVGALRQQTLAPERYEILVVDDGSTDATAALARRAGARVVQLPRTGGAGAARNAGLREARGEIVVFTDADCEPRPDFLEALVRPLEDPAVGGSKGTYLTRQRSLTARFVQIEYEDRYRRMAGAEWIDFVDTYAACFRRADLERVGGFVPGLRQVEDQELSFRLAEGGVRIRFVPNAQTYHLHADRLAGYLLKKYRIARWKVEVLRRHPRKAIRDSHTPQAMKLEMLAAGATALALSAAPVLARSGAGPLALAPLTGGLALFLGLAAPLVRRAFRRDRAVGLAAPGILFLRDLALLAGLVVGTIRAPRLGAIPSGSVVAQAGPTGPEPGRREAA